MSEDNKEKFTIICNTCGSTNCEMQEQHVSPKDYETAIKEYVIANTHKDVFNYLYNSDYTNWDFYDDDELCDIMMGHGESYLENDWSDAYYGITEYDWELCKSSISEDEVYTLVSLGIAKII